MTDANSQPDEVPVVLVTGFGPFRNFSVNPSWLVVQELAELGVDQAELVISEIPVEYGSVKTKVPSLWQKHKPKLVVHCGVSSLATTLVLEELAHNNGYNSPDVCNRLPTENCCQKLGNKCLKTCLDVERVCQKVTSSGTGVKAILSRDAGRYLCEFIYYSSLNISPATAFIHVPPVDTPYSVKQLAAAIRIAITEMLSQIHSLDNNAHFCDNALHPL